MAEGVAGRTQIATNGNADSHASNQQLLANGLEHPWAVPASGGSQQRQQAAGGRRSDGGAADDWALDPHDLGRRSKSLTLDDVQGAFGEAQRSVLASQLPPAEAASSRSWMKPFGRKKRAARQEEGLAPEGSLSASGRTIFTPAELQQAASAGPPAEPPAQHVAPEAEAAAPTTSGRRLWSRSQEHVAGRDPRPSSLSRTEPTGDLLERSKSSTEAASGSRWNPFSRGNTKSAATTPNDPVPLTSGVQLLIAACVRRVQHYVW